MKPRDQMVSLSRAAIAFTRAKILLKNAGYEFKSHQVDGVKWMINNELKKTYKGGLICDDPGLGKTIQTMGIMAANPVRLTLIVLPTSVLNQWIDIVNHVFGSEQCYVHYTNKRAKTRAELLMKLSKASVAITSYALISDALDKSNHHTILHSVKWDRVVFDEGHQLRNHKTLSHRMACDLHATYRWILTGTPIQNRIGDIATLIKFIIGMNIKIDIEFVRGFIKERMLRRKMEDVGIMLPSIKITHVDIDCNGTNKSVLKKMTTFPYKHHLESIIRRKQASVFPQTLNKSFRMNYKLPKIKVNNEKADYIIDRVIDKNENCIIFTEFKDEIEYIISQLTEKKETLNIASICGDTPLEQRDEISKDKSINVLVIQINTAGVGLNLQHFSTVHFTNIQWNPANTDQAIGRIKRIGQENPMEVYIYSVTESIDNRIAYISDKKREMITRFLVA